jgi:hypothetical protein
MFAIPAGFCIAIVMRFVAGLAIISSLWFVADAIGDAREARVYRKIQQSIARVNSEIDEQLSLDEKIAVVAQRAREKALAEAKAIPAVGPICPASEEQATALSRIK